eukprot:1150661-Pelagomonas_calceolata.AAC.3
MLGGSGCGWLYEIRTPNSFQCTSSEVQVYHWFPGLKNCRLAHFPEAETEEGGSLCVTTSQGYMRVGVGNEQCAGKGSAS